MSDWTGWFLVNVLVPVLLPVFGIVPLKFVTLPPGAPSVRLMSMVKDGQLCWTVVGMGASTTFEVVDALSKKKVVPSSVLFELAGVLIVMLAAILVAALGAVFTTAPLLAPPATAKAWAVHYKTFVASAVMTFFAAVVYTLAHTSLPQ